MADRKLINDYEDAVMNLAVSDMLEQYGRELEEKYNDFEDIPPTTEAAEKFEKELNKAYRNGQLRSFRTKAVKFGKYAVTVCAAFIVVFAVSVVSVDALRFRFLEWLIGIHGSHSSLDINQNENVYSTIVHADYLPYGYKLIVYNDYKENVELRYSNGTDDINIYISLLDSTFNSDNEDTSSENVLINGYDGIYQKKESLSTIFWYNGESSYNISTTDLTISKEEFIKIAQSIN